MIRLAKLQLIGPSVLFIAFLAAEVAGHALAYTPSSEILWFINLRLFGIIRSSYYVWGSYTDFPEFELYFVALPLFAAACYGVVRGRLLVVALASNLSLVYAGFMLYSWNLFQPRMLQASLTLIAVPSGPDSYLLAVLLSSSLLSCFVSHFLYLRAVRAKL